MAYTTIDDPSAYFQTVLYSSDGGGGSITVTNDGNSDLQPDWLWIKVRNGTNNHNTFDTSRGIANRLKPNTTDAEDGSSGVSVSSDGFATGTSLGDINNTSGANNYVAWQWKANGGTTTSVSASGAVNAGTHQANTTAGFSIVTYTGEDNSGDTVTHGLGAVPHFIIIKNRDNSSNWVVYHHKNTSAPETDHLLLNVQNATSDSNNIFSDTAPTSTVFTVGTNGDTGDADAYVAYCFTEIQGYSKFGSYTGNGNADGPFIYTGFKPAFFIVKRTDASGENFVLRDNKVSPINPVNAYVVANDSRAEANHYAVDLLSNGFKVRTHESGHNHNGGTYIYMALAESPFVSSEGVPTTAR
jgi:hypothetical protein